MKYKVFLDSNQVFSKKAPLDEVFNLSISDLSKFLKEQNLNNVYICLPEIVIRERVQQRLEDVKETIDLVKKQNASLKKLGHKLEEVKPLDNYKETFEKNADEFLKKYKVIKVQPPSVSKEELIDRAINKMKPFNDNSAGFKDTLIYLSIVEDAFKKDDSADRYIFCTNDSGEFTEEVTEEFKKITGKDLFVVPNISKVTEKLDELVPLKLHLKERNDKIRNLIMNQTGDLIALVNKTIKSTNDNAFSLSTLSSRTDYSIFNGVGSAYSKPGKSEIVGYNYNDITFVNFDDIGNNLYQVSVKLTVDSVYSEKDNEDDVFSARRATVVDSFSFNTRLTRSFISRTKTFDLLIDCDLNTNSISARLGLIWP